MRVYSVDLPVKPREIPLHSLRIEYPGRRVAELVSYERNADVSWAPSSDALYVSHNWGSNVADCYVYTLTRDGFRRRNLTNIISRQFKRAGHFIKRADHGYVVCHGWEDARHIDVVVYGDIFPYEYEYTFTYDRATGVVRQLSAKKNKQGG